MNLVSSPFGAVALLAVTSALAACERDECVLGHYRCFENAAQTCQYRDSDTEVTSWYTTECGDGSCRLRSDGQADYRLNAYCVLDATRDARCGVPDGASCHDNLVMSCREGYAIDIEACDAETPFCVEPSGLSAYQAYSAAFCAVDSDLAPECASSEMVSNCRDNAVVHCIHGYADGIEPCGKGTCVKRATSHLYRFCTAE